MRAVKALEVYYYTARSFDKAFQKQFETEQVPLLDFLNHMRDLNEWTLAINDPNSGFNKLLFLEDIFLIHTGSETEKS